MCDIRAIPGRTEIVWLSWRENVQLGQAFTSADEARRNRPAEACHLVLIDVSTGATLRQLEDE